jgi:hypothetical protein
MFEKEDLKAYDDMATAIRVGTMKYDNRHMKPTPEALAILVAGKLQRDLLRRIAGEVCSSLDNIRNAADPSYTDPSYIQITRPMAEAIVDMDNNAFSVGLGPDGEDASEAWDNLMLQAEDETGRQTDRRICL